MHLRDSILATIVYYDGFEHPLSAFEIYRYLINPARLSSSIQEINGVTLKEIQQGLDELMGKGLPAGRQGTLRHELGFYMLADRSGFGAYRLAREKISAQKWRRCLRRAYWLQIVPWIRGMFVSGSLALETTEPESDFDMLTLVRPGRLYIARLALSLVASLMGARRTRFESTAPDKFCFNHYLTADALSIPHESLYNAQTYARLVPMMIDSTLAGEFYAANLWINKYVYSFTPHQQTIRRTVRPSPILQGIAQILERIFDNAAGDFLESLAKKYQQRRISQNPATHAAGGRVIYTDTELEFHPQSFEKIILHHYNDATRRLNLSLTAEPDSGLNI